MIEHFNPIEQAEVDLALEFAALVARQRDARRLVGRRMQMLALLVMLTLMMMMMMMTSGRLSARSEGRRHGGVLSARIRCQQAAVSTCSVGCCLRLLLLFVVGRCQHECCEVDCLSIVQRQYSQRLRDEPLVGGQ